MKVTRHNGMLQVEVEPGDGLDEQGIEDALNAISTDEPILVPQVGATWYAGSWMTGADEAWWAEMESA